MSRKKQPQKNRQNQVNQHPLAGAFGAVQRSDGGVAAARGGVRQCLTGITARSSFWGC